MEKKLLIWQGQYMDSLAKMTNEEILDEYTDLTGGDDYDGCLTTRGAWRLDKATEELHKRLRLCNFLTT